MTKLNLLVVEGNLQKENENFRSSGIPTHSESLKESLSYYTKDLNIDVFNPCSEKTFDKIIPHFISNHWDVYQQLKSKGQTNTQPKQNKTEHSKTKQEKI